LLQHPARRRPLGRPKSRWEDNINLYLKDIGWDGMDWMNLAEEMEKGQAVVHTVMNLQVVPYSVGNFLTNCQLLKMGSAAWSNKLVCCYCDSNVVLPFQVLLAVGTVCVLGGVWIVVGCAG
jgi:hypothetical protein